MDNRFRAPNYRPGKNITAKGLNSVTSGIRASPISRSSGGLTRNTPNGQIFRPHASIPKSTGSSLYYIEITGSTSISEYTGTIYDNPTDRTDATKVTGVTVYAKQHDAGTIPNSASGQGKWAVKGNDDKYYLTNYSVFYG